MKLVEYLYSDFADYFHELDDSEDAPFGEYAEVGPREWNGEAISFTVSGNGNAVRITIEPIQNDGSSSQ